MGLGPPQWPQGWRPVLLSGLTCGAGPCSKPRPRGGGRPHPASPFSKRLSQTPAPPNPPANLTPPYGQPGWPHRPPRIAPAHAPRDTHGSNTHLDVRHDGELVGEHGGHPFDRKGLHAVARVFGGLAGVLPHRADVVGHAEDGLRRNGHCGVQGCVCSAGAAGGGGGGMSPWICSSCQGSRRHNFKCTELQRDCPSRLMLRHCP